MNDFDDLDLRILDALQRDASGTNEALAQRVFSSQATVLRRVRTLRESGVIEAIRATLSPTHFSGILTAICEVSLDQQNAEAFTTFELLIRSEASITQCYQTAPAADYTLVLTLQSMEDYNDLVQRVFTAAHNVRNVRTRFATKRVKASLALPVKSALAA